MNNKVIYKAIIEQYSSIVYKIGYVSPGKEVFDPTRKVSCEIRESFDLTSINEKAKFPDEVCPDFRRPLTELARKTRDLASTLILKALASSLEIDDVDFFNDCHKRVLGNGNFSKIRTLFYPPLNGESADYKG